MEHRELQEELFLEGFSISSLAKCTDDREEESQMPTFANVPELGVHFAALIKIWWFFYLEQIQSSQNRMEGITHGMI